MSRIVTWVSADHFMRMQSEPDILFFDGICNLCNSLIKFILRHDRRGTVMFSPLQSDKAKAILSKYFPSEKIPDSVILLSGDKIYVKSSAILETMRLIGGPWKLFRVFMIVPPFVRNFIYDIVAGSRYRIFGKREECMIPGPDDKRRFLS